VPSTSRLQQFVPAEVVARLALDRAPAAGDTSAVSLASVAERRVVTVLFCDVKGSTALAEQLDPEEWTEIMNGAFERLIKPVTRYGGTVARLMGDAILAFFGAPTAHEDDPRRAVLAGLAIVEGMRDYRQRARGGQPLELDVRVGINTGLAVVGEVGSSVRAEYTAMGDAVNLAARMEQTAQPGTVQVSGNTLKFVAPLFDYTSLGALPIKGKAEPVEAYRILAPRRQPEPGRRAGIDRSPLVGRERELTQLRLALEATRRGEGRVITIVGEAGLGKSRLIGEARAAWDGSDGGDGDRESR
jgi:class 3 adenylate cyclase